MLTKRLIICYRDAKFTERFKKAIEAFGVRVGDANRTRVETRFRREGMVEAYRSLYQEVLDRKPRAGARPSV